MSRSKSRSPGGRSSSQSQTRHPPSAVSSGSESRGSSVTVGTSEESFRQSRKSNRSYKRSAESEGHPGSPHQLWDNYYLYSHSTPGRKRKGQLSLLQLFYWFRNAELLDGRVLTPVHLSLVFNEFQRASISLLQLDALITLLCTRRLLGESKMRQCLEDAPKPKEAIEMGIKLDTMMFYDSGPNTPSLESLEDEKEGESRHSNTSMRSSASAEDKTSQKDTDKKKKGKDEDASDGELLGKSAEDDEKSKTAKKSTRMGKKKSTKIDQIKNENE